MSHAAFISYWTYCYYQFNSYFSQGSYISNLELDNTEVPEIEIQMLHTCQSILNSNMTISAIIQHWTGCIKTDNGRNCPNSHNMTSAMTQINKSEYHMKWHRIQWGTNIMVLLKTKIWISCCPLFPGRGRLYNLFLLFWGFSLHKSASTMVKAW